MRSKFTLCATRCDWKAGGDGRSVGGDGRSVGGDGRDTIVFLSKYLDHACVKRFAGSD
jgi:hypothetical protein